MAARFLRVLGLLALCGGDLKADARKILRKGVMEFDGEACTLFDSKIGACMRDLFAEELLSAAVCQPVERPVPEDNRKKRDDECADRAGVSKMTAIRDALTAYEWIDSVGWRRAIEGRGNAER